jgi:hypothetical protein
MAFDPIGYQLERLASYPGEQWRMALSKFAAPSNRPPQRFWRDQRTNAIAWLAGHGVIATEYQGIVSIGDVAVDTSYVNY